MLVRMKSKPGQMSLLIVEDDPTIADLLAYNLRRAGYLVIEERDGRRGLHSALACDVDLVLLDLMLPELDGMSVSREIAQRKPDLPIIMLTARREREAMLEGFDSGADDYLVKPFDLDELLLRIAARLRRRPGASATPTDGEPPALGDLMLDTNARMLRTSSQEVPLKPMEHDLLELLLSQPGHLFRREEIVRRVWHQQYIPESRTLDVHVRHVRRKLEEIGAPVTIQTIRGVGYRAVQI